MISDLQNEIEHAIAQRKRKQQELQLQQQERQQPQQPRKQQRNPKPPSTTCDQQQRRMTRATTGPSQDSVTEEECTTSSMNENIMESTHSTTDDNTKTTTHSDGVIRESRRSLLKMTTPDVTTRRSLRQQLKRSPQTSDIDSAVAVDTTTMSHYQTNPRNEVALERTNVTKDTLNAKVSNTTTRIIATNQGRSSQSSSNIPSNEDEGTCRPTNKHTKADFEKSKTQNFDIYRFDEPTYDIEATSTTASQQLQGKHEQSLQDVEQLQPTTSNAMTTSKKGKGQHGTKTELFKLDISKASKVYEQLLNERATDSSRIHQLRRPLALLSPYNLFFQFHRNQKHKQPQNNRHNHLSLKSSSLRPQQQQQHPVEHQTSSSQQHQSDPVDASVITGMTLGTSYTVTDVIQFLYDDHDDDNTPGSNNNNTAVSTSTIISTRQIEKDWKLLSPKQRAIFYAVYQIEKKKRQSKQMEQEQQQQQQHQEKPNQTQQNDKKRKVSLTAKSRSIRSRPTSHQQPGGVEKIEHDTINCQRNDRAINGQDSYEFLDEPDILGHDPTPQLDDPNVALTANLQKRLLLLRRRQYVQQQILIERKHLQRQILLEQQLLQQQKRLKQESVLDGQEQEQQQEENVTEGIHQRNSAKEPVDEPFRVPSMGSIPSSLEPNRLKYQPREESEKVNAFDDEDVYHFNQHQQHHPYEHSNFHRNLNHNNFFNVNSLVDCSGAEDDTHTVSIDGKAVSHHERLLLLQKQRQRQLLHQKMLLQARRQQLQQLMATDPTFYHPHYDGTTGGDHKCEGKIPDSSVIDMTGAPQRNQNYLIMDGEEEMFQNRAQNTVVPSMLMKQQQLQQNPYQQKNTELAHRQFALRQQILANQKRRMMIRQHLQEQQQQPKREEGQRQEYHADFAKLVQNRGGSIVKEALEHQRGVSIGDVPPSLSTQVSSSTQPTVMMQRMNNNSNDPSTAHDSFCNVHQRVSMMMNNSLDHGNSEFHRIDMQPQLRLDGFPSNSGDEMDGTEIDNCYRNFNRSHLFPASFATSNHTVNNTDFSQQNGSFGRTIAQGRMNNQWKDRSDNQSSKYFEANRLFMRSDGSYNTSLSSPPIQEGHHPYVMSDTVLEGYGSFEQSPLDSSYAENVNKIEPDDVSQSHHILTSREDNSYLDYFDKKPAAIVDRSRNMYSLDDTDSTVDSTKIAASKFHRSFDDDEFDDNKHDLRVLNLVDETFDYACTTLLSPQLLSNKKPSADAPVDINSIQRNEGDNSMDHNSKQGSFEKDLQFLFRNPTKHEPDNTFVERFSS